MLKVKIIPRPGNLWQSIGLFALLGAMSSTAAEQAPQAAEDSLTLEAIDEKVRLLERKLELQEEDDAKKKLENATVTAGKDGFSLSSADKESHYKFRFFQHVDGRYYHEEGEQKKLPNTLLLRRVRPIWEGKVGNYYNFRVMPEFAGTITLLDAYGEIAFWPEARLRVGKSKTPVGLERLKSAADMDLIEFAHPTSLTPNYDLGISLHGDLAEEAYSYSFGVFNGAIDGAIRDQDFNDDKDLMGRVFAHPFKAGNVEILRNFGIGLALSYGYKQGDSANTDNPTVRSEGQQQTPIFTYRTNARDTGAVRTNGKGYRINPQGYWYTGPFGFSSEYVASTQTVSKGGSKTATTLKRLTHSAWQATLSYVVTGETPSYKGLKPRHPLSLNGPTGFGALELIARASQIQFDEKAFPVLANPDASVTEAFTYAAGFNWYLSRFVKFSTAYAWTKYTGGVKGGNRPEEKVIFSRVQTSF